MKEKQQAQRLQEAKVPPPAHLWPQLERRLSGRRDFVVWRQPNFGLLAAASLVLMLLGGTLWHRYMPTSADWQTAVVHSKPNKVRPVKTKVVGRQNPTANPSAPSISPNELASISKNLAFDAASNPEKGLGSGSGRTTSQVRAQTNSAFRAPGQALSVARNQQGKEGRMPVPNAGSTHFVDTTQPKILVAQTTDSRPDSIRIFRTPVALTDSALALAQATQARPDSAIPQGRVSKRKSLLHKLNHALQWLPGGSAWPVIRFERSGVALADNQDRNSEPAF